MMADPRRLAWGVCTVLALAASPTFARLSIVEPTPLVNLPRAGFEFGAWMSSSAPTGEAGDVFERGISAGVSATDLKTSMIGMGVDLAYRRWPSPATGASLDAFFSSIGNALGSGPISGTKVAMTSVELGAHGKVSLLPGRRVAPWVQVGIGFSRADRKIEFPADQMRAAGWEVEKATLDEITYQPLLETCMGFDVNTGEGMKIGLDASYQWLMLSRENDPFTAFRVGGHVLFGSW